MSVRIIEYSAEYQSIFRHLNVDWITQHWQLEESDLCIFDDPQSTIIDCGGQIFIALLDEVAVGCCALIRSEGCAYDYELAKLAVSPKAQGHGIGRMLCQRAIDEAHSRGGKILFLESNRLLLPALHLYSELGFVELPTMYPGLHSRGDIQMELRL